MPKLFLIAVFAVSMAAYCATAQINSAAAPSPVPLEGWSGKRAMEDIAAQVSFGPRSLGAPGHDKIIDYLKTELAKTKAASVKLQQGAYEDDEGAQKNLINVIAQFDPDNPRRIIVGTHYDSIARAYRDKSDPDGYMPGANNSASGVALLLETARALSALPEPPPYGVDFVFFDGEEGPKSLGAGDPEWRPLGSPWFARHLNEIYPAGKSGKGVVFDMVCDRDLDIKPERASYIADGAEVGKFWDIGRSLAPKAFLREPTAEKIGDDQVALNSAGIPSFLVIDFDYEPWFNTTQDTIDKCAPESLEAVGRTLLRYLYTK